MQVNQNFPSSIQISVSRTLLGLGPLVIGPGPSGTYLITTVDGQEDPDTRWDRSYARRNRHIDGGTLVAATKQQTELLYQITIRGTGSAHLRAAKDVLIATFEQFQYNLTETIDLEGPRTWSCDVADLSWLKSRALRANHHAVANLTIPIHPKAA